MGLAHQENVQDIIECCTQVNVPVWKKADSKHRSGKLFVCSTQNRNM